MYLGLDLGTSGLKALLIDESQSIIGSANSDLTVSRLQPKWSEQSPSDWIAAAEMVLARLSQDYPKEMHAVRGIGLSGQMHGATLLGESDQVLRPCILWNDTRSHEEAAQLDVNPSFRRISGNIVFPGFTAPKLMWVKKHEPELFDKIYKVLLPKDYLRLWLTGEYVGEMSDASGTSWLDTGKRQWSTELLSATGMEISQMPRLVEGTQISGQLRTKLAEHFGMSPKAIVAGGAGDNAASAVGMGTVAEGTAYISLGTSGVLLAANSSYMPNPESALHTFCHALPRAWHQMGVVLSAADSLNWFANLNQTKAVDLSSELDQELTAPGNILFLPYLNGERTPHNDAFIRAGFFGMGHKSDRKAMTQAILEGVTFAFRDNLEALHKAGTELQRVTAVGGGSRSTLWLKMISTALGIPVDRPVEGDFGAAFGAARLGLIAAENCDPLDVCQPPALSEVIEPDLNLKPQFDEAFARYQSLYQALKPHSFR